MLVLLAAAGPAAAQAPERGFATSIVGFDDVNGNGKLDCGEPVTVQIGYFDVPQDTTPAMTGGMTALYAGSTGLSFLPGTVTQNFDLTAGSCQGAITAGNNPSDPEADVTFSCGPPSANPTQGNGIAWTFQALFTGTAPSLTAVAHGTTSDGLNQAPSATQTASIGNVCTGAGASVTVTKTAAGNGAPGSTIVYTLRVTDLTGLGLGGVQLTDVVPAQTRFDAAVSSAAWSCPATTPGTLCTLPLGNVPPSGTSTAVFAVTLASPLAAGTAAVANTACARQGPSQILGCASASLPTTGAAVLKVAKSVLSGSGTPGATLTYQLVLSNTGNQDSGAVSIQETVPSNTTWSAAGSAAGWACAGTSAGSTCKLAVSNVPAGGSVTTSYAVVVANPLPTGTSAVVNTACVAGTQTCDTLTSPTNGTAAVSVHKSLSGTATPGGTLTYTVTVQSTGNEGAAGVTVTDTVPPYTSFLAAASTPGWSCASPAAGSACSYSVGSLAAGGGANLVFAVQVQNPLPAGASSVGNTACASFQVTPTDPPVSSCDTVSTPTLGQVKLVLAKQYTGGSVEPGAVLSFTLDLSDTGNQNAGALSFQETVPQYSSFDAAASTPGWNCTGIAAGSTCTLAVAGLAAGATSQAVFAVTAAADLPAAAVIENAACAKAASGAAACATAVTPSALTVATMLAVAPRAVSVAGGVATPSDVLQYTLTVPNAETATLEGLVSTLTLDPHETLVAGSVATDHGSVTTGNAPGDSTVVVTIGNLAPGEVTMITFSCKIASDLPVGTTVISAQALTSGTNVPADASDDPATPQPHDPTSATVTVSAGPVQAVPILGGWGLVLLSVGLSIAAVFSLKRRREVPAAPGSGGAGPFAC